MPIPRERPAVRPEASNDAAADRATVQANEHAENTPPGTPRPVPRSAPVTDAPVARAMLNAAENPSTGFRGHAPRGILCRDPRLVGAPAPSLAGTVPGCGIAKPVRVASISGIKLSVPITVDCRTARAFADWVSGVVQPAARETLGSGIRSLWVMGSYQCRTRNNRPGRRLSEHASGRAVDLGGLTLLDGRRITVRGDWGKGEAGDFLRIAHEGACGPFTTVIGPEGDRQHKDHLHLDTAYRDGTWCR